MPSTKLTRKTVDALKPADKDRYLWDTDVAGFGVKVTPAGGKTYLYQYRDKAKRTRRVTIGKHGAIGPDGRPWVPENARQEAQQFAAAVVRGDDPAAARTTDRQAPTFRTVADRYLSEHVDVKKKRSTAVEYRRLLETRAAPVLGDMKLKDVQHRDVSRLHTSLQETPYAANRLLAVLSSFFSWAARHELYSGDNPARHVEKYSEEKRERYLSEAELAAIGHVLSSHEEAQPVPVLAARLLLLTGMRKNEVLGLTWAEVDMPGAMIRLEDSKTGAKKIPLAAPALETLAAAEKHRQHRNPHVFPGQKPGSRLIGIHRIWYRWRAEAALRLWHDNATVAPLVEAATGETPQERVASVQQRAGEHGIALPQAPIDVRLHDFRHSFASVGASGGDSLLILGSILGHASASTTARYAHLQDDPRRAAAERIASKVSADLGQRSGEVVPFTFKRGAGA
jgi:integrase